MLALLALSPSAFACTPVGSQFGGFDPWLDGGGDVPTDARLVFLATGSNLEATLTRVDSGDVVPMAFGGSLAVAEADRRVAFVPAQELEPETTYRLDVSSLDYTSLPLASTTFETASGPAAATADAPGLSEAAATAWTQSDDFYCILGNPVVERQVTATITIPPGLPSGSYVTLRSPGTIDDFDFVAPVGDDGPVQAVFVQGEVGERSSKRDCLTPIVILPAGAEITGRPLCVETLPESSSDSGVSSSTDDAAKACGCSSSVGGATSLPLLALIAVARRQRRTRAPVPCRGRPSVGAASCT